MIYAKGKLPFSLSENNGYEIMDKTVSASFKRKIVVVSLFNGLSGARLALKEVPHLNVLRYYSSEVDKYAIKVADHNFPQDIPCKLGDVTKVDGLKLKEEILKEFGDVAVLLVGGSPCQGFSMAGKLKGSSTKCGKDVVTLEQYLILKEMGFEFDGQSYLFWEYVRIWKELNPKYFLLENVRVTKKWLPMFNDAMGVEPTRINSRLLSPQNRDRYYWHNLGRIEQPNDERQHLVIRDILEDYVGEKFNLNNKNSDKFSEISKNNPESIGLNSNGQGSEKSGTVLASYYKRNGGENFGTDTFIKVERPRELQDVADNKNLSVLENGNLKVLQATKKGFIEVAPGDCFDLTQPNSKTRRGRDMSEKSNTIMANTPEYYQYLGRPCDLRDFKEDSICHHTATATDIKGNESIKRVYAETGKAPSVTTCQGGHREPKVLIDKPIRVGTLNKGSQGDRIYSVEGKGIALASQSGGTAGGGSMLIDKIKNVNPSGNGMNGNVYGVDAKSPTVTTNKGEGSKISYDSGATYRKLTPRECARLQMIPDSFEFPVSNSQWYKMVGNGFTISVKAYILGHI